MNKPTKIPTVQDELDAMDASKKHGNLHAALIAAQAEMAAPRKDREVTVKMKTGGSYKFSYATMAAMVEADKPILAKHGLGFVQYVMDGHMVTRILHESGESLNCPLPMPNLPNAPQEAGSIITYFKRYSYSAAFGRVADEEDDANIAEGNEYTPRARPTTGETPPKKRVPLAGPYTSKTQLWAAVKAFVHAGNGMGDLGEWIAYRDSKDVQELLEQCKRDAPGLWSEGLPDVPEYEPLEVFIARRTRELEEVESLQGVK